ncbi:MAG: hypothetical protein SFZ02_12425 [bacterium]|nr:hypothetical protein [bacterium]
MYKLHPLFNEMQSALASAGVNLLWVAEFIRGANDRMAEIVWTYQTVAGIDIKVLHLKDDEYRFDQHRAYIINENEILCAFVKGILEKNTNEAHREAGKIIKQMVRDGKL